MMSSVNTGGSGDGNDAPAVSSSAAATSNGPKEGDPTVSSSSAAATAATDTQQQQPSSSALTVTAPNAEEQEPQLLVKEFPPPPNYYRLASIPGLLTKPTIPKDAIARGTHKARKESERLRELALEAHQSTGDGVGDGDAMMGANNHNGNNVGVGGDDDNDDDGDITAIFGEILEDPTLLEPVETCPDPTKIRDEVQRLNRTVLQLFISLTQDLGGNSSTESETTATKTEKDLKDLSYNILLMLQETNKFREHQSRELLIELLEDQLRQRLQLIDDLEQKTELGSSLLSL